MNTATMVVPAKCVSQYKDRSTAMAASTLHRGGDVLGLSMCTISERFEQD